jgi:tetratricopeptide (TPR) repeat protein
MVGSAPLPPLGEERSAVEAYRRARALAQASLDVRTEIEALLAAGDLAVRIDRLPQAEQLFTLAQRLSLAHFDLWARAHLGLAEVAKKQNHLWLAKVLLRQARALLMELGDLPALLEVENQLGAVEQGLEQTAEAEDAYRRAERLAIALGNPYLRAAVGNNLGTFAAAGGRTDSAEARFLHAAEVLTNLGEAEGTVSTALNLAWVSQLHGDLEIAATRLATAEHQIEQTGQEGRLAEAWSARGLLEIDRGDPRQGFEMLAAARLLFAGLGRGAEAERLAVAIFAAEAPLAIAESAEGAACLSRRYFQWDARVFAGYGAAYAPPIRGGAALAVQRFEGSQPRWSLDARGDPRITSSPILDLEITLGAASVLALSDWGPKEGDAMVRTRQTLVPPPPPQLWPNVTDERFGLEVPEETTVVAPPPPAPRPTQPSAREGPSGKRAPEHERPRPEAPVRPAEYERILDTFIVPASRSWLLEPEQVAGRVVRSRAVWAGELLVELAAELDRRGRPQLAAAAEINAGAIAWYRGDAEVAYDAVISARRRFAQSGDARGLMIAQRWLALFLLESGAEELAQIEASIAEALLGRYDPR